MDDAVPLLDPSWPTSDLCLLGTYRGTNPSQFNRFNRFNPQRDAESILDVGLHMK